MKIYRIKGTLLGKRGKDLMVSLGTNKTRQSGIYIVHSAKKGKVYKIHLAIPKIKLKDKIQLWVKNKEHTICYYQEYIKSAEYVRGKLFQYNGPSGEIHFGIRFMNKCQPGNHFVLRKFYVTTTRHNLYRNIKRVTQTPPTLKWTETTKEEKSEEKIKITVALPAQCVKKIIWLALEGLRNQKIPPPWELIVWDDGKDSMKVVKSFMGKLPNCKRIIYRALNVSKQGRQDGFLKGKFPLIDKWIGMALDASSSSEIFVLQAADCYSPPNRLRIHQEHFDKPKCFFSTQTKGLFFNLLTKQKMFYDAPKEYTLPYPTSNHLNMAMRRKDTICMMPIDRNKVLDSYIVQCIKNQNKIPPKIQFVWPYKSVDPEHWKYSVDTDGANRITMGRRLCYKKPLTAFFKLYTNHESLNYQEMEKYLPLKVIQFLQKYK